MHKKKKKKDKKGLKRGLIITGVIVLALAASGVYLYRAIFTPFNLPKTVYIYIDNETDYEDVIQSLKEKANLPSEKVFRFLAERTHYPDNMKTGRYAVEDGMTGPDLIRRLRSGDQSAVNLTFNNMRTVENLAGRFSKQLMIDSLSLLVALKDPIIAEALDFNVHTLPAMFIPNTYQVYWDTDIDHLLIRMKKEYDLFWNDDRKKKAEQINLSPIQVSILASIVEEEAMYADEYPIVAGLYLNRLKKGMRLEADPTVKFAVGDFSLRRILHRHLEVESPYNTYKNEGLPPGPIRIPSIKAIDATLSPQQHNYIFMCAKDDLSGRHNFATTYAEHARNAAAYQRALNRRGIY